MKKWQIKRKSAIGQQLVTALDNNSEKWVTETNYGEPSFEATKEEAHKLLAELKDGFRGKWIRLYEIIG